MAGRPALRRPLGLLILYSLGVIVAERKSVLF
jgi:hypothetical protein